MPVKTFHNKFTRLYLCRTPDFLFESKIVVMAILGSPVESSFDLLNWNYCEVIKTSR